MSLLTKEQMAADLLRRNRIKPNEKDFQAQVEGRLAGPIDPKLGRHIRLRTNGSDYEGLGQELPEDFDINIRGLYHPEGKPEDKIKGTNIITKPNQVMTLHNNNTPNVWAHEYRHRNYPELMEDENRVMDMVSAKDDWEVDDTIRMWANRTEKEIPSEAIPKVKKILERVGTTVGHKQLPKIRDVIQREIDREGLGVTVDDIVEMSKMSQFIKDVDEYEEWNSGLKERNEARKKGEPETIGDTIRRIIGAD